MRVPFSDPQAYRTDRFHSAMLTAVEFFEFVLLLLALCQLQGVPWDYLLNELVFLRQLTPLLVMSRFESLTPGSRCWTISMKISRP